ncbi:hypothetical protein [Klebsiella pneumoniae IS22]|nr:hypothetical protein [Klebsiella pneumoniae IS22]
MTQIQYKQCQLFFHETIHWWQHVGSVSGIILSLCYPAQIHINHVHLKDLLKKWGR